MILSPLNFQLLPTAGINGDTDWKTVQFVEAAQIREQVGCIQRTKTPHGWMWMEQRTASTSGHGPQPSLIWKTKASGKTKSTSASQDPDTKRHKPVSWNVTTSRLVSKNPMRDRASGRETNSWTTSIIFSMDFVILQNKAGCPGVLT